MLKECLLHVLGTGTALTATEATTAALTTILLILLVLLELLGRHDLLQLSIVLLLGLLTLLASLFHLCALLLGEFRHLTTLTEATARTALAHAATTTATAHASETAHQTVVVLLVEFEQLLGLVGIQFVLLYGAVGTHLNHLFGVELTTTETTLCEGCCTHHKGCCQCHQNLFHFLFGFKMLYLIVNFNLHLLYRPLKRKRV